MGRMAQRESVVGSGFDARDLGLREAHWIVMRGKSSQVNQVTRLANQVCRSGTNGCTRGASHTNGAQVAEGGLHCALTLH
jgi:hypothetical protein